jgi:hypothetical protein
VHVRRFVVTWLFVACGSTSGEPDEGATPDGENPPAATTPSDDGAGVDGAAEEPSPEEPGAEVPYDRSIQKSSTTRTSAWSP